MNSNGNAKRWGRSILKLVLGAGMGLLVPACGGTSSSQGPECNDALACGGDVVGTWKIDSSCISIDVSAASAASAMDMQCPGLTGGLSDIDLSGSITYRRDGTYEGTATIGATVVLNLPAECITRGAVKLTCDQVQQASEANRPSDFSSVKCGDAPGGGCSCMLVAKPVSNTSTGQYSVAGGLLDEGNDGGGVPYCVKGNTMTVQPAAASSFMSGMSSMSNMRATAKGYLRLLKQ